MQRDWTGGLGVRSGREVLRSFDPCSLAEREQLLVMEPARSFRDLRVWQAAIDLQREIVRVVADWPVREAYRADQMRRAARSVHANIAEGNGKPTRRDYLRFLYVSRGSLQELESDVASLRGAADLASADDVELLTRSIRNVGRLLAALIRSLSP